MAEDIKNVVVIINCHGAYIVNDDLTIDLIPAPENKRIEIVKTASFGYSSLLDFEFTSRYPDDKMSKRFSEEQIQDKLISAYHAISEDISLFRNKDQYKSRSAYISARSIASFPKRFGSEDGMVTHVGIDSKPVPFLRKVYSLQDGYLHQEKFFGIILTFKNKDDQIVSFNLNKYLDLKQLEEEGYIHISEEDWATITANFSIPSIPQGQIPRDFAEQIIHSNPKLLGVASMSKELLLRIIESFPTEYGVFKIVDDSCAVFLKADNRRISAEQSAKVVELYGEDMKSCVPSRFRGGKKTKKVKKKIRKPSRKIVSG
jgi:hypothetical protein